MSDVTIETNQVTVSTPAITKISDGWVWAMCGVPLLISIICAFVDQNFSSPLSFPVQFGFCFGAYVVLCKRDSAQLKRHHLASPSAAWLFLVPVYIWKRQTIVQGSRAVFWVFLVSVFLSPVLESPQVNKGAFVMGLGIPSCTSDFASWQTENVLNSIPVIRSSNATPVATYGAEQDSFDGKVRVCHLNYTGANGNEYRAAYKMYMKGDSLMLHAQLY